MLSEIGGQDYTTILAMECCTNSIKTTFNSIFSHAVLSRVSWTTLHKNLACPVMSQEQ